MNTFVGDHMAEKLRVEATRVTGQVLLGRVSEHMRLKVLLEPERFRTTITLVRLVGSVNFQVSDEILL